MPVPFTGAILHIGTERMQGYERKIKANYQYDCLSDYWIHVRLF